jgi:hypothetical protein
MNSKTQQVEIGCTVLTLKSVTTTQVTNRLNVSFYDRLTLRYWKTNKHLKNRTPSDLILTKNSASSTLKIHVSETQK